MTILANIQLSNTSNPALDKIYGEAYIHLVDAATGNPVNGNNVAVRFTQNINGSQTDRLVTIPGQSITIYSGLIADKTTGFYVSFTTPQIVGAVPDPPPPINVCDLRINFINVDKSESVIGASDGQITINASSSYGPIQYSNDFGTTWQLSPIFTGLKGGLSQPTVRDSNPLGCTVQGAVNIPTISNLLFNDPSVTLPGGNISRWSAAFNPIVFTYQRKDFGIVSITQDTAKGYAKIAVNTALLDAVSAQYKVKSGDKVYLNTTAYLGVYEVDSVGNFNEITIIAPFAGNASGYININSMRPYYKVITRITYQDKLTGTQNTITSTNMPDNDGIIKADLSNFLQSLLRPEDSSDYTQPNFRDDDLSASYQLEYAEHYDDGTITGYTTEFTALPYPFYVVYAAKQLGERYGGNLAAYVPFKQITDTTQLARWVTDFPEPAYSIGYPFDIGFIYSEDLLGVQLYCDLILLDINRVPLAGGPQTSSLLNEDGSWLLNQDGNKFIIANQTQVNTSLPAQLGLNRLQIKGSFPREAFYLTVTLKYDDEQHNAHTVTQTQTIRIDDAVDDNSVYLRWVGLSGSWNYYRFVFNQEISLDVQNAVIIKNFVNNWETQQGIEQVISKTAGQKMKVMAEDLSVIDGRIQWSKYVSNMHMDFTVNLKLKDEWTSERVNSATFYEGEKEWIFDKFCDYLVENVDLSEQSISPENEKAYINGTGVVFDLTFEFDDEQCTFKDANGYSYLTGLWLRIPVDTCIQHVSAEEVIKN